MKYLAIGFLLLALGCENRDLNEGEAFQPREIHENISFSFDKILVDGVEYLILEKDNNNPHEGFGFMAFRANQMLEKQDTLLAYLKSMNEMQIRLHATLTNRQLSDVRNEYSGVFEYYLSKERVDLNQLEKSDLRSTENSSSKNAELEENIE